MIFLYRLFGKDTKIQVLESKIKYFLITTWFSAGTSKIYRLNKLRAIKMANDLYWESETNKESNSIVFSTK